MPAPQSIPITSLLFSDGSPEGVIVAKVGALCLDRTSGALYIKQIEGTSAGWVSIQTSKSGSVDGLADVQVARATLDPSAIAGHRTIGAHGLGVTIPDNAIVTGGFIAVDTTFTSATDAATIAISLQTAGDVRAATAISTGVSWDAGKQPIIPKSNTPEQNSITLTAAREVTATVAVEALTAGKAVIFLSYLIGN